MSSRVTLAQLETLAENLRSNGFDVFIGGSYSQTTVETTRGGKTYFRGTKQECWNWLDGFAEGATAALLQQAHGPAEQKE